jgi:7-cyano-7-deazaguanine reductase
MQLGEKTELPASPDQAKIEVVKAPQMPAKLDHIDQAAFWYGYVARFTAPEFTSLCPVTGQPDFARIIIDYMPKAHLIESKSLKLFLGSFRNHGAFHEACTMQIAERLYAAARPSWMRVVAIWYPRGGIPIDIFWQSAPPPEGILIPDLPKLDFVGR